MSAADGETFPPRHASGKYWSLLLVLLFPLHLTDDIVHGMEPGGLNNHMKGAGVGGDFAKRSGAFFFIWTRFALSVTGAFGVVLAVRGRWSLRTDQPRWSR